MAASRDRHDVRILAQRPGEADGISPWHSSLDAKAHAFFEACHLAPETPPPKQPDSCLVAVVIQEKRAGTQEEKHGGWIGVAVASQEGLRTSTQVARIQTLAVHPAFRRLGLGQKLWKAIHHACFNLARCSCNDISASICPAPILHFHSGICDGVGVSGSFALLALLNGHSLTTYGVDPRRQRDNRPPLEAFQLRDTLAGDASTVIVIRTATAVSVSLTAPYLSSRPVRSKLRAVDFEARAAAAPPSYLTNQGLVDSKNVALKAAPNGLPLVPGGNVYTSPSTGCCTLVVDEAACLSLEEYIENADNYELRLMPKGSHHACLRIGPKLALAGYDEYGAVFGLHAPSRQASCTKKSYNRAQLLACIEHLPGLRGIASEALKSLGVGDDAISTWLFDYLKNIHLLCSDWSQQTIFDWHSDHTDVNATLEKAEHMVSIIVQLSSDAVTGMQLHGFQQSLYEGRGAVVAFHGCAVHRSTPTYPRVHSYAHNLRVHKIALFFVPV